MAVSTIPCLSQTPVISGSNGTYIGGGYTKIGNIVLVNVLVETTSEVGSSQTLLANFPSGGTDNHSSCVGHLFGSVSNTTYAFRIWSTGLYPNATLPAGKYHIFGIYSS